jgi:hypothetical protein
MSHAKLSPSSAHRWLKCTGSIARESAYPNTSSKYADWGTAAHEVASNCLTTGKDAFSFAGKKITVGKNIVAVDDEMVTCVQVYIDNVREYAIDADLMVEQRLEFSEYVGVPKSFGTSDAVIIKGDEIQVHDLKGGRGVKVDADHNEQLMLYALGALSQFGMVADFKTVRMVIHQPRLYHLSEWAISVDELLEFAEFAKGRASKVIAIVDANTLDLNPGEKQCRFCRAKADCPALSEQIEETIGKDFGYMTSSEADIDIMVEDDSTPLSDKMSAVDLIEGWCNAVRAEVERQLFDGKLVSGYKLVEGRKGDRKWANEVEAEQALKDFSLKDEEMYNFKLISPANAEKLVKNKVLNKEQFDLLKSHIVQSKGKPSVAPESDKRAALSTLDYFEVN